MPQDRSEAGRKGGSSSSQSREHMSEMGKKGGRKQQGSDQTGADQPQQSGQSESRGGSSEQHRQAGRQSHKNQ